MRGASLPLVTRDCVRAGKRLPTFRAMIRISARPPLFAARDTFLSTGPTGPGASCEGEGARNRQESERETGREDPRRKDPTPFRNGGFGNYFAAGDTFGSPGP